MAESYAQLALLKRSSHPTTSLSQTGHEGLIHGTSLEDKVLSLAKLLRSTQMNQDDLAADQRSEMQHVMQRMAQLEEAVRRQSGSSSIASAPSAHNIKALAERLALVEQQLTEGLTENHDVHSHNSKVVFLFLTPGSQGGLMRTGNGKGKGTLHCKFSCTQSHSHYPGLDTAGS